jgi:hypothetical protein
MAAGIQAMLEQIRAVADFSHYLIYRLSGGYDSRAVFGALLRERLLRRSWCWTFPHLKDDFEVVKLLVNYYGGDFAKSFPWHLNAEPVDIAESYRIWSSHNFGLYSTNLGVGNFRRTIFNRKTVIVLSGGGGECFRDFYFPVPDIEEPGVLEREVARLISRRFSSLDRSGGWWWRPTSQSPAKRIASIFSEDFRAMPGGSLREKFRSHYLNFRNRFHFGSQNISTANRFNLKPLMQISFLDAADILRASGGNLSRIFYDVFSALDKRLPFFPFDKEEKEFKDEIIHNPDAILAKERLLGELRDLKSRYDPVSITTSFPAGPRLFSREERTSLLDDELKRAIQLIRESRIYESINFNGYVKNVEEARKKHPDSYAQYRSSLISTAHLLEYTN